MSYLPVEPSSAGRYPVDMESRVAVVEQIAGTPAFTLELMERERPVDFGRPLGIVPGGLTMMLGAFGALLGVIAHGSRRP